MRQVSVARRAHHQDMEVEWYLAAGPRVCQVTILTFP